MSPSAVQTTLSTHEVAALCGISYRMIDYWARSSPVLRPTFDAQGSGSRRGWTEEDVERIRKAAALSNAMSPLTDRGRSTQGLAIETLERFVREAELYDDTWYWSTDCFTLRVCRLALPL